MGAERPLPPRGAVAWMRIGREIRCLPYAGFFPHRQVVEYQVMPININVKLIFLNQELEHLLWLIFLKDDIVKNIKFAHAFDKT